MAQRDPVIEDLLQQVQQLELQADVDRQLIETLHAQGEIDRSQITNLETALVTCRRIGAAIGILMATHKITQEQAFALLQLTSQRSQRKLRDVADDVLLTGVLPTV